jgi:presenilin-like A22 family membrane protease
MSLFIITQLIGLAVINFYLDKNNTIPYGFDQKEQAAQMQNTPGQVLTSLLFSFVIVILFILFLMKIKSTLLIKIWFFGVITLGMSITLSALLMKLNLQFATKIALALALIFSCLKVFKKNVLTHNLTEVLIYPGIAPIFVLMLNLPVIIIILILISIYDVWAVWHSGIMQKMAQYQMNEVGIFGGLIIPYASNAIKNKIKFLKEKYKNNIPKSIIKKSKLKINLAILGGGDIFYPLIAAGIVMKTFGSVYFGLIISLFAALGLGYLFIFGKKHKPYPAMPYITTGVFLGMLVCWLIKMLQ